MLAAIVKCTLVMQRHSQKVPYMKTDINDHNITIKNQLSRKIADSIVIGIEVTRMKV